MWGKNTGWRVVALLLSVALHPVATTRANEPLDEDLAEVTEALSRRPTDPTLRAKRVELWLRAGRPREALADLDVLDGLTPDPRRTRPLRADALAAAGEAHAALALLDAHLADVPDDAAAHERRARLHQATGALELASADWSAAFYAAPTVVRALGRAEVLRALGRPVQEARACREALATLGEAALLRWCLVGALERAGADADALAALDEAPRLAPVRRRLHRALLLAKLGRAGEAAIELEHARTLAWARVRRRPSLAAWQELAAVARATGRADDARAAADHLAALRPRQTATPRGAR